MQNKAGTQLNWNCFSCKILFSTHEKWSCHFLWFLSVWNDKNTFELIFLSLLWFWSQWFHSEIYKITTFIKTSITNCGVKVIIINSSIKINDSHYLNKSIKIQHWLLYNNDWSTKALQTTRWFPWRQQGRGHLFTQKFSRLFWARSNTADAMEQEAAERHDITDSRSSRQRGGTDFKSLTTDVKLRLFFI